MAPVLLLSSLSRCIITIDIIHFRYRNGFIFITVGRYPLSFVNYLGPWYWLEFSIVCICTCLPQIKHTNYNIIPVQYLNKCICFCFVNPTTLKINLFFTLNQTTRTEVRKAKIPYLNVHLCCYSSTKFKSFINKTNTCIWDNWLQSENCTLNF